MKRIVRMGVIILGLAVGCARPPVQVQPPVPLAVLAENIQWARENLAVLEQLPLPDTTLDDCQRAASNLNLAESAFAQGLYDEAYLSASQSLAISQELVRQFYEDSIAASARATKTRIEAITSEDPESPLQEFLPMLTEILDYSEGLGATRQELDVTRILADFEHVTRIAQDTHNTVQRTLESDISFESGEYRLSDQGQAALAGYCEEILRVRRGFAEAYPERDVRIRINIMGYTDQIDFKHNTNLIKLLTADIDPQTIPRHAVELRKFLNRRLSDFRAATLGDVIRQHIEQPGIHLELHSLGLGEELPPGVPSSDVFPDPRRRICKIHTYILLRPFEE